LKSNVLKGAFLVGLGATSYGMLATFVKLAYQEGFTTAEVTISQFTIGIIGLLLLQFFQKSSTENSKPKTTKKERIHLILAGTTLGMTSVFYYLAVKYIPVSIAIVLLMQTVWMGVILEMIMERKLPSIKKIIAVCIVLIGTLLATNLTNTSNSLNWQGLFWGLLAASSFTATMVTANRVAVRISSVQRSFFMLLGGAIIVLFFAIITQKTSFNFAIFIKWGIPLSLFGTILPPILMNAGFPSTGIGLGSIISALELPVSVAMAYFLLHEEVLTIQWIGILLIIAAIVLMHLNYKPKSKIKE
jgi:drug/metabolite transporter (DMT)-like permease